MNDCTALQAENALRNLTRAIEDIMMWVPGEYADAQDFLTVLEKMTEARGILVSMVVAHRAVS